MSIKWIMFGLFLWLGLALLSATMEYAWIGDSEASRLSWLINGMSVSSWITGAATLGGSALLGGVGSLIFGNRAWTAAGFVLFVGFAVTLRDILFFNYPSLFYGPYEIIRWIFIVIGGVIFIATAVSILRGVSSS